ncbi:MAG: glycosyltransferase [Alicyclobacillus sp.]|nr:glycosyltransferase [Alicyclobacillus sp.]
MEDYAGVFSYRPVISIIMPVYNVPVHFLEGAINSVKAQIYREWELCIYDDGSCDDELIEYLNSLPLQDSRIRVDRGQENRGIVAATNAAIKQAQGEFIAFMDNDDELTPDALYRVAEALQYDDYDLIYSDEDKIDYNGNYCEPYFKPDWSPDLLLSGNYISHLAVYKKEIGDELGWLRAGYDGSQDYDLNLRVAERTNRIHHIPLVLYHWRKLPGSTAADPYAKPYAYTAGRRALEELAQRNGIRAKVSATQPGHYRFQRLLARRPKVTVIASHEHGTLGSLWESKLQRTLATGNIEIVSLPEGGGALSRRLNEAASRAKGDVLLFLSPAITDVADSDLEAMLEHALRKDVAAVGCKLVEGQRVMHAGIVVGVGRGVAMAYEGYHRLDFGYFGGLIDTRNCSAVSGHCMMCRKDLFLGAGGFSEDYIQGLFDVDFCLRMREQGFMVVYTPYAELSLSGRLPKPAEVDWIVFEQRWGTVDDPYYNPNLNRSKADYNFVGVGEQER